MKKKENINQISSELFKKQIKEKMEIINNNELENIPSSALPETFSIDYYFISYSHKDYKEVYYDIFLFQYHDMHIWYDRGIPAGKDWKEVAQRNITPFECKGVILYISENSLMSKAVIDEIRYVQEVGKQFVCITLPFKSDYLYKGESVKGKYTSILGMIEILKENKAITPKAAKELKSLFNKETIYLPYKTPSDTKVEKIKLFTPTVPLLNGYFEEFDMGAGEYTLTITSIRDHMVNKISKQDFYDLINDLEGDIRNHYLINFDKTSLANCYFLETIEIGPNMEISIISEYAFANDEKFKGFNVKEPLFCSVGAGGFYNCKSLTNDFILTYEPVGIDAFNGCESVTHIELTSLNYYIGDNAFRHCKSLKEIEMPEEVESIGSSAFAGCESLKEIFLPDKLIKIKSSTFSGCSSLEKVTMGDNVEIIDVSAFRGCRVLKNIVLSKKSRFIGRNAFQFCDNIKFNVYENINYLGTRDNPYFMAFSIFDRLKRVNKLHEDCVVLHTRVFHHSSHNIVGSFVIPDKVTQISDKAFFRCDSLTEVVLLNKAIILDDEAFFGCRKLESIKMGKDVQLKEHVFWGCSSLKEVTFYGTKEEWKPFGKEITTPVVHCLDGDLKNK